MRFSRGPTFRPTATVDPQSNRITVVAENGISKSYDASPLKPEKKGMPFCQYLSIIVLLASLLVALVVLAVNQPKSTIEYVPATVSAPTPQLNLSATFAASTVSTNALDDKLDYVVKAIDYLATEAQVEDLSNKTTVIAKNELSLVGVIEYLNAKIDILKLSIANLASNTPGPAPPPAAQMYAGSIALSNVETGSLTLPVLNAIAADIAAAFNVPSTWVTVWYEPTSTQRRILGTSGVLKYTISAPTPEAATAVNATISNSTTLTQAFTAIQSAVKLQTPFANAVVTTNATVAATASPPVAVVPGPSGQVPAPPTATSLPANFVNFTSPTALDFFDFMHGMENAGAMSARAFIKEIQTSGGNVSRSFDLRLTLYDDDYSPDSHAYHFAKTFAQTTLLSSFMNEDVVFKSASSYTFSFRDTTPNQYGCLVSVCFPGASFAITSKSLRSRFRTL